MPKVLLVKKAALHPLSLLDRLTRNFVQEDYILSHGFANLDILFNRMATLSQQGRGQKIVFTIYPGGDCSFINTMKDNSAFMDSSTAGSPDQTITFIQENILGVLLGLTQEEQQEIVSMEDVPAALKALDDGEYALGFIY
ncbi:hypothetical protein [Desulfotomaculum sp. 1211_IL3151]|uniref:hypothetical protein n=1 Tax=Desulfotomaculum sp. 1211_IL3151 TaxID=3084055 RepID=UPI002FD9EB6B